MNFYPEYWKVVKIEYNGDIIHKLLCHWVGGYLDGDAWRLNSGITNVVVNKDGDYEFYGHSGSVYVCNPNSERVSGYMEGLLDSFKFKAASDSKFAYLEFVDLKDTDITIKDYLNDQR